MMSLNKALVDENNKENINTLVREILDGNVVFFVGSAVSYASPSCLIGSRDIKEKVLKLFYKKIREDTEEVLPPISKQEKLGELALELLFQIAKRHLGNYALEAYNFLDTGNVLDRYNQNHLALALVARYSKRKWIFTTNFGHLIEDALEDLNIEYLPHYFVDDDETIEPNGLQDEKAHILKLHGTVENRIGMSATIDQIGIGYGEGKTRLLVDCIEKGYTFCFVGYGFNDFDFYSTFRNLGRNKRIKSYVFLEPKKEKSDRIIDFLTLTSSIQIEYDINNFFEILCNEFEERRRLNKEILHRVKGNKERFKDEEELRRQQFEQLEVWSKRIDKYNAYRILGDVYYYLGEEYCRNLYEGALKQCDKDIAKKIMLLIGLARSCEHTQLQQLADKSADESVQLSKNFGDSYLQAEALRCSGEMKMVRFGFHPVGINRLRAAYREYDKLKRKFEKESPEKVNDILKAQAHCLQLMYSWCSILPRLIIRSMYSWYNAPYIPKQLRPSFLCPEKKLDTSYIMMESTSGDTLRFIGILKAKRGEYGEAEKDCKDAKDISNWYKDYIGYCSCMRALSKIYQWIDPTDRNHKAEDCLHKGLETANEKSAYKGDIIKFYLALANLKKSREYYNYAWEAFKDEGIRLDRPDLIIQLYFGKIWYSLADFLIRLGENFKSLRE